jgi:hypothetical protein
MVAARTGMKGAGLVAIDKKVNICFWRIIIICVRYCHNLMSKGFVHDGSIDNPGAF